MKRVGAFFVACAVASSSAAAQPALERFVEDAEPCSGLSTDVDLQFVSFELNIDRFKATEIRDFRIAADRERAEVEAVIWIACETRPSSQVDAVVSAVFDIRAEARFDDCDSAALSIDVSDLDVNFGDSVRVETDQLGFFEEEAERRLSQDLEPRVVEFCDELAN